jgi:hypothetical protein
LDGRRLVDLWQCGGKALLGHKAPNIIRDIKNTAETGLLAPFHSVYEWRLLRALGTLFPKKDFRFYQFSRVHPEAPLWRPFACDGEPFKMEAAFGGVFRPVLPFALAPDVLVFNAENTMLQPVSSELVSPMILAATVRAVYDLTAAKDRGNLNYKKIMGVLEGTCAWRREGIYIYHKAAASMQKNDYEALREKFFNAGFFLSPNSEDPLILPGELSGGEESALAALLAANK